MDVSAGCIELFWRTSEPSAELSCHAHGFAASEVILAGFYAGDALS